MESAAGAVGETVEQIQILAGRHPSHNPSLPAGNGDASGTAQSRPADDNAPGDAGGGFEINDYRRTAEAIQAASRETRDLLAEIREALRGDEVPVQIAQVQNLTDATIERSAVASRRIIDHAAWRAAQLMVLVVVLAVVGYRLRGKKATFPAGAQRVREKSDSHL